MLMKPYTVTVYGMCMKKDKPSQNYYQIQLVVLTHSS